MTTNNQTHLWLDEISAALAFAAREAERSEFGKTPDWRWLSVALVKALQASLIVALSGYETALPEDIRNPSAAQDDAIAPVPLLLRRARSADYLSPPEQLTLYGPQTRHIDTLLAYRNASLHTSPAHAAMPRTSHANTALDIIEHTILRHPAFPPQPHTLNLALITDHLRTLRVILAAPD